MSSNPPRMVVALRAAVLAACCAGVAHAAPGDHVQLGDSGELTPAVHAGVEARTNALRAVPGQARGGVSFALVPSLGIKVDTPSVRFRFNGRYELRKYFEPQLAERLDQFSNFRIRTSLEVPTQSVVGFVVREHATLQNRAIDAASFGGSSLISQFRNELYGGIPIRPGPDLRIVPGFEWAYHDYQVPGAAGDRGFDTRNTLSPKLDLGWRFFPNTEFVVEAQYDMHRWEENWVETNDPALVGLPPDAVDLPGLGYYLALPDSQHLKAVTGVRGRFTDRLVIAVLVGYGFGLYDEESVNEASSGTNAPDFEKDPAQSGWGADVSPTDAILVQVRPEVDFGYANRRRFGQKVGLQYRKDFQDSFFTNYVHRHDLRAWLDSLWGTMVRTRLGGGASFEDYVGEVNRNDIFARVDLSIRVEPTRYLDIEVAGDWTHRFSNDPTVEFDNIEGRVMIGFTY